MRLYINFSVVLPLYVAVARELQRRYGVGEISGFVYGTAGVRELQSLGVPTDDVGVLSEELRRLDPSAGPDLDYLRAKEREYGIPNLTLMITACRFVSSFEHRRALRVLETGFRLMERIFDRARPDAVLSDGVACTMSYIQYVIAQKRGIPFLTVAAARTNGRFYIIRNNRDRYERVEEIFEGYKRHGLPREQRERAEAFVAEFRANATKPRYFLEQATYPRIDLQAGRTLLRVIEHAREDPHNYILVRPAQAVASRVQRIAKAVLADRKHFEEPVEGERFVFFPLHDQPEMTTLVLAPFHIDQVALIENIAKSLPIDHLLYVKEHKASLGRRAWGYYERIRRIPNVRLISPYWDSHDLIKRSSAVCVISSTVGWETLLYEKPLVTFGEVFYNAFDQVRHVRALPDLPQVLQELTRGYAADHELLLAYVAALLEGTYPGDAYYIPGARNRSMEPDNVVLVARGVAQELGLQESMPGSPDPERAAAERGTLAGR